MLKMDNFLGSLAARALKKKQETEKKELPQKSLEIIFLGKKPKNFDSFLLSFKENIEKGRFFHGRFVGRKICFSFWVNTPKRITFDFVSNLFSRKEIATRIFIHFGSLPKSFLKEMREEKKEGNISAEKLLETAMYSISGKMKGGRQLCSYQGHRCRRTFVKTREEYLEAA